MKYIRLIIIFLFSLSLFVVPVFAQGTSFRGVRPSNRPELRQSNATLSAQEKRNQVKADVCERRFVSISKRMESLVSKSVSMMGKFDAIVARVEEYYTTTAVPAGNQIDDYDSLVAEIASKKVMVEDAITATEESQLLFTCDSDEPKGLYTQFREDMKEVKSALHEYRFSIKDLIVAVRSAKSGE